MFCCLFFTSKGKTFYSGLINKRYFCNNFFFEPEFNCC